MSSAVRRVLCVLALACSAWSASAAPPAPAVAEARIDLRGWQFESDGPAALDGTWRFHAGVLLDPRPGAAPPGTGVLTPVPAPWNKLLGTGRGHGSYQVQVDCDSADGLALSVPMQHSAIALYANGRQIAAQGVVGTDAASHRPSTRAQTVPLAGLQCPLLLVAHVGNHEMWRGGLVRSLQVGTARQLNAAREQGVALNLLALGAVLATGVVAVLFFTWRRHDRTPLYFGLFALCFGLGLGLAGERALQGLASWLGFEWHLKLLYASWYAGIALFPMFLRGLYPQLLPPWVMRGIAGFSMAGVAVSLLLPMRLASLTGPALQVVASAVAVLLMAVLARLAWRGDRAALVLLGGLAALAGTIAHDVVFFHRLLAHSLLPYGTLGFILAPALLLARRFARALQAEEARALEQGGRAELLVRATRAGMLDWDGVTGRVTHSERYLAMLGLPAGPDAPEPPPFRQLVHPDDEPLVHGLFLRQLADRSCRHGIRVNEPRDYRMRHASGEFIWVHAEAISVCGADGRTLRYICSFIDITAIKRTEQQLATERERLALLVRSTRAGFGDWDAVRDVVTYTDRFKEMLGHPPDADTSGWPSLFEWMHPDDREAARAQFRAMLRRKPQGGEQASGSAMSYRLRRADGSYVWVHAEGIAQVDGTGRTRRFITSYMDVTRLREQEEALRASRDQIAAQAELLERQNEALKEVVRLREEVERIGRHDIKTPLNSIVAVPRLLREERQLGPEADELLGVVERAGYRILSMVNLSLDLYKMEQGSYVFRPDAVDLADLLHKLMADLRLHAASKQVALRLQSDGAPYAWAEELLCYSLLANLLKNAVEASPSGAAVAVEVRAGDAGGVRVEIHNAGAVPSALRASFFQKYATLGKASGTGLGAYSARLMARVQDGDVHMHSSEADGTTLTVVLRAAPAGKVPATLRHAAERRGPDPARLAQLPPRRVLLVDDDEYNLLIVRRFLPQPPFTVETAINGKLALEAVRRGWPDLVLMDLDMPVMGGLETVAALRALERSQGSVRHTLVALSSHEDAQVRAQALAAGFDRYLTKPVTRELIQETLLSLEPAPAGGDAPAVWIAPDLQPLMADFLASRRALAADLLAATRAGDREGTRRLAHQLAGGLAMYGFAAAAAAARQIEDGHAVEDLPQLGQWADALALHLATVQVHVAPADAPA